MSLLFPCVFYFPARSLYKTIQGVYYYFYQLFKDEAEAIALRRKRRGAGDGTTGMFSSLIVAALAGYHSELMTFFMKWSELMLLHLQPFFARKTRLIILHQKVHKQSSTVTLLPWTPSLNMAWIIISRFDNTTWQWRAFVLDHSLAALPTLHAFAFVHLPVCLSISQSVSLSLSYTHSHVQ